MRIKHQLMSQGFKDLFWPNSLNSSCSLDLKRTELTSITFNTDKHIAIEKFFNVIVYSAIFTLSNHESVKEVCTFDWMAKEQGGKTW